MIVSMGTHAPQTPTRGTARAVRRLANRWERLRLWWHTLKALVRRLHASCSQRGSGWARIRWARSASSGGRQTSHRVGLGGHGSKDDLRERLCPDGVCGRAVHHRRKMKERTVVYAPPCVRSSPPVQSTLSLHACPSASKCM
jgi:hypothetical protein